MYKARRSAKDRKRRKLGQVPYYNDRNYKPFFRKGVQTIIMGDEVNWQVEKRKKRRSEEAKKRRKGMVPMGNTLMKRGTMIDLV